MSDDPVTASIEDLKRSIGEMAAAIDEERTKSVEKEVKNPAYATEDLSRPILTLGQLKDKISYTMRTTVNDWVHNAVVGIPQLVLPELFLRCHHVAEARLRVVTSILSPTDGKGVDKKTMRDHMVNNYEELFLLTPSMEHARNIHGIITKVSNYLHKHRVPPEHVRRLIEGGGLEVLATTYLEIIVNVNLQQPRATFQGDCGRPQVFQPSFHDTFVDGEIIKEGQVCLVAFPAMLAGGKTWSPMYALGCIESQPTTTAGEPAVGVAKNDYGGVLRDLVSKYAGNRGSWTSASQAHTQDLPDHDHAINAFSRPPQGSSTAYEGQIINTQGYSYINHDRQRTSGANRREPNTTSPHRRR